MLKLIQEIIYNVTGKSNITDDTDFVKDLELNSFDVMNIVCAFEEYFDVTIPTRDVWKMHQVKDVIKYMEDMSLIHISPRIAAQCLARTILISARTGRQIFM